MDTCGMSLVKFLVVLFNFILVAVGIALIAIGSVATVELSKYGEVMEGVNTGIALGVVSLGAIILLVSFLGCCGAWNEVKWMVGLYATFLVLIFFGELVVLGTAFAFKGRVEAETEKQLTKVLEAAKGDSNVTMKIWDKLQPELKCCGIKNFENWFNNTYYQDNGTNYLPTSCCTNQKDSTTCTQVKGKPGAVSSNSTVFSDGCLEVVTEALESSVQYIAIGGIIFALIQVIGIFFGWRLVCSIDSD